MNEEHEVAMDDEQHVDDGEEVMWIPKGVESGEFIQRVR